MLGALMAVQQEGSLLDWRLVAVTLATFLVVAYAFIINDIEDAPDDALEESRRQRNPVSAGRVSLRVGYTALVVVALVTLGLYALAGTYAFVIGVITLIISHLYSWRKVRLKAWPVTDIVSHSLMLSGLLFLAGYFTYGIAPGLIWFVFLGVTLFSSYGQLYNQLRDFDVDKEAGLHNTAILLGERNAKVLMYTMATLAAVFFLIGIIGGAFPWWLLIVVVVAVPVSFLFRPRKDFRGTEFVDASGAIQQQALFVFNAVALVWLVVALVMQVTAG
ncbi:MAG: UbiA prenyltransferase family protein [Anaerolineae bacterium]